MVDADTRPDRHHVRRRYAGVRANSVGSISLLVGASGSAQVCCSWGWQVCRWRERVADVRDQPLASIPDEMTGYPTASSPLAPPLASYQDRGITGHPGSSTRPSRARWPPPASYMSSRGAARAARGGVGHRGSRQRVGLGPDARRRRRRCGAVGAEYRIAVVLAPLQPEGKAGPHESLAPLEAP